MMSAAATIVWADLSVRRVRRRLASGVLIAPWLFAWVLLRPGYSPRSRSLGFSWLALRLVFDLTVLAQFGLTPERLIGA